MKFRRVLNNLPIRYKIVIACTALFIPFAIIAGTLSYSAMRDALESQINRELSNSTESMLNLVQTSVRLSIRNYLRSVSEKNRDIINHIYQQQLSGKLSEAEAKERAVDVLLSQQIAKSGYIYCLDSTGTVTVHPEQGVQGRALADTPFIGEQMRRKNGYIEYDWKNPDDAEARHKALWMVYFEPWDWIISATAYRDEFDQVVNIDDFKESIQSITFLASGYSYVLDAAGDLIVHPTLQGENVFTKGLETPGELFRTMLSQHKGELYYEWKNPGEARPRKKVVVFDYIPEVDWFVASSAYLDDLYRPINTVRNIAAVIAALCLLGGVAVAMKISTSITRPISLLREHFSRGATGDYSVRMNYQSLDEIGQLSAFFNRFMEKLETEIRERKQGEIALRLSQERYRIVMESAPDPIMVQDEAGKIIYLNAAFTEVFGWELRDFASAIQSRFVPVDQKSKEQAMLAALFSGHSYSVVDAVRMTRAGDKREVTISGGGFRDSHGEIRGCVLIFRDITERKRLERQVIETDDQERIRVGQDLHDDLAPHLIGIEVMCRVLHKKILAHSPGDAPQAETIRALVEEATRKTRALARGLCPVHLVEEGLGFALRELADSVSTIFDVSCQVRGADKVIFQETTAVHIYRIAQEAIHNAVKHAEARHIDVLIAQNKGQLTLEVSDDGKGFPASARSPGMGLRIMDFRAHMIGASLDVESNENQGTTVRLHLNNPERTERGAYDV
jgi:PAS domain S-box-containing protein